MCATCDCVGERDGRRAEGRGAEGGESGVLSPRGAKCRGEGEDSNAEGCEWGAVGVAPMTKRNTMVIL
eukprot:1670314-Rhodomonas_salina.1